ncbi:hypothetical protein MGG_17568 [Pyricularia oryzae 70-15]|uniref:Uncharacterized protein n=3 Tax=Pyricularia oryzae TaxID=318829 RepID=G4NFM7_PYRO7|nr:uncharacterized protein MGG_17568 [Pyricularia oryzae 70-15]EHA46834.1 hypothetical protein MGG_17568 [Pyricularia oryzae 70-15]ELQ40963.1 hypothetical protein OOU_Y34scaffold00312g15 [Pyricularia oryzae Y34]
MSSSRRRNNSILKSRERILTSSAFVQDEWSYEAPSLPGLSGRCATLTATEDLKSDMDTFLSERMGEMRL